MQLAPKKVFHRKRAPLLFITLFLQFSISTSATSPTTVTTTTTTTIPETASKIAKGDGNPDCKTTTSTMTTATSTTPTGVAARLARANILELSPYRCARDDYSQGILLDANENAYGPAMMATSKKPQNDDDDHLDLHRYPDPYQIPLKLRMAKHRGNDWLTPSHFFIGVGSDEAIDLLMRIFCKPGHDAILTTPPTYGMYKVCAKVNDLNVVNVPLTPDFNVVIPNVRLFCMVCSSVYILWLPKVMSAFWRALTHNLCILLFL
jgi:Aminotransferase class I and II